MTQVRHNAARTLPSQPCCLLTVTIVPRRAALTATAVAIMSTAQATVQNAPLRTHLTLKGSVALVSDFLLYGIQSILYQRDIYPSDDFKMVKKFNTQVLTTIDEGLHDYLQRAMQQVQQWLTQGEVRRIVVAIVEKETQETIERWQFDIEVANKGQDETDKQREAK